jgi:hypothetical protein
MDVCGSGQRAVKNSCEYTNEPAGCVYFSGNLYDHDLLKKDYTLSMCLAISISRPKALFFQTTLAHIT